MVFIVDFEQLPVGSEKLQFQINIFSVPMGKTLPCWAGKICQNTNLVPYSPNKIGRGIQSPSF